MSQPNILFIQTDQLSALALPAYGNTYCVSPHLDALASQSTVFENAYCNFPLCAPSRYSMAAGQLASRIGAYDNAVEFPATIPTYAHYLREQGYQTCLSGKMHFVGPDQLHGFEERLTPDIYPADFSWAPNWENEGQRDTSDTTGVTVSGVCKDNVQLQYDELVQRESIAKLRAIAQSQDSRPFFLQVSFTHPHDPYLCRPEHWERYDEKSVPPPQVSAMPGSEHDPHSRRILAQHSMLDFEFKDEDIERARRAYFGSISFLDDCVGELIETLKTTGQIDNTIIVFTSDHGEMLGERGMWFKKTFFEPALRIPLFVRLPAGGEQTRVKTLASLVDLLPTFIAFGKTENQVVTEIESLDGDDLMSLPENDPNRTIYAEYLSETTPAPIYMIRQGRFKFIHSVADPDLLFAVDTDPNERQNLATDPAYADVVDAFRLQIDRQWDNKTLTEDILLSQRRRQLLLRAMKQGNTPSWDFENTDPASIPWYRGVQGYNQWAYKFEPVD